MTTTLVVMARRNTPVFYPAYQGLVSKLLDRGWQPSDGMATAELQEQLLRSVAAHQLIEMGNDPAEVTFVPMSLQEFYLALGVSEMMETNHFFFDPDELEIRDNMVMFVEDAHESTVWAAPLDQVTLPDPIVYRRTVGAEAPDGAGTWETTDSTVSEFITDILTWNYTEDES